MKALLSHTLSDAFKMSDADHDKVTSPEQTIERFKKNSRAANLHILKETRRIDNNRLGIPVFYSVCGHDAGRLTGTKKQMGKGVTPALAEASAVMELAERFSLYSFMDNDANITIGKYGEIPETLPFELIRKSVKAIQKSNHDCHDGRDIDEIDRNQSPDISTKSSVPPDHIDDQTEILQQLFSMLEFKWVKAFNYSTEQEMSIPMDWFFMINEFNGSSAGNCHEEAICQGACEIIERHVSAIVCKEKPTIPCIDPNSVTNPTTAALIKKFTDAGIKLYINDFSLDTGVPTVGVLAYDPSTFPDSSEIVWTAGTAPNPDKALSRALTEVAQLAGDFNTSANYVASGLPKYSSLDQAAHIIGPIEQGTCPKVAISDLPDISSPNIKDEIEAVIDAMKSFDFELIIVNTTDPRLEIPACYTIVPGTCFRERAESSSVAMFAARHVYSNASPEKAMQLLDKMAQSLPDQYYIEFYRGLCRLDMEDPEQALTHLEAAMEMNPAAQDIPSICSYSGVCLKNLGRYEDAVAILEKGVTLDDERPDLFNLLGFCHFMLKNHEASISCFENVLKITPGSGIDHASIASNYRELGNYEKAVDYYELALALDPSLDFAKENIEKLTPLTGQTNG